MRVYTHGGQGTPRINPGTQERNYRALVYVFFAERTEDEVGQVPQKKPHVPSIWRSRRLWHDLSPRDVPWRHNTIRCRRQSGGTRIVSDTIPRLPPSIEATSTRFVYQVFLQKPSLLLLLWYGHFHHSCKKIALEKKLFLNCCEKVALRGIPFSLQVMRRERFVPWTHCGR